MNNFRLENDQDITIDIDNDNIDFVVNNRATLSTPWIEKYRPNNINDLVLNKDILTRLNRIIETKNMPNIILTGPPGVGKTSTVLCIAKNLFGKYFNEGVIEMNASDDRGIKMVHETIEQFCKKKLEYDNPEKYAGHKIVLLDEADNMTNKAKMSINILMDSYNKTTRFAFTCNSSSEILESIQSKCIIIRFEKLSNEQITTRLKYICEKENIKYDKTGLETIVMKHLNRNVRM